MENDLLFNHLMIFKLKQRLAKGLKPVVRNRIISSNWWCSFQKKLKGALYVGDGGYRSRKIIQNGASFVTIQILATFLGQNFQVVLWRDLERNNLGNYLGGHLNIIPATVFPISCYFWRTEIAVNA